MLILLVSACSLEQLHLNKNNLNCIWYPDNDAIQKLATGCESFENNSVPFLNLCCLLLGNSETSLLCNTLILLY